MLYSLYLSFFNYNPTIPVEEFVGLENYIGLLKDPEMASAVYFSIFFTGAGVAIQFMLGLGIALLLGMRLKGTSIFKTFILLPMMTSEIVVGVTFMLMCQPGMGVVDYLLSLIGIRNVLWLSDPNLARWAVLIADTWNWTPLITLVLLAGIESLPIEPYESALIDGASRFRTFIHITLPLLRPIIMVALLIRLIFSLKTFGLIVGLTAGGPGIATRNVSFLIFMQALRFWNIGYASAFSWIFIVAVILLGTYLIKLLTEREEMI
jgi:multiple sugar transport system permease protein